MVERRDRSRRLMLPPEGAAAEAGVYDPGGPELARALDAAEARAGEALRAIVAGRFPVGGEDRRAVALFLGIRLLLAPGHRAERARAAEAVGALVVTALEDRLEEEAGADVAGPAGPGDPLGASLAGLPTLARALTARTWQVVRFPGPLLITGDTPAAYWSRPASVAGPLAGAPADEVRFPVDPRHALILARHAPSGEVVRDVGDRHARALNRTIAEAAHEWIFYHPGSDPLEAVELAPS
jgi:hypothetical protein